VRRTLIDSKLVADSIPWPQADIRGGFYNGKNNHPTLWPILQRLQPQLKDAEYTDHPRGRVLYDSTEKIFRVYSARAIISNLALRKQIAKSSICDWGRRNSKRTITTRTSYPPCSTRTLMPKIDVSQLVR